jgi:hypothetical protein
MKVFICLEFDGVDCDSKKADAIVESITQACEGMQKTWGASSCWVDDAFNDGVFMIQKYYGDSLDEGWQNALESGMLFDSKQEALEVWFEDAIIEEEIEPDADLTQIPLPENIRIVEIKGV